MFLSHLLIVRLGLKRQVSFLRHPRGWATFVRTWSVLLLSPPQRGEVFFFDPIRKPPKRRASLAVVGCGDIVIEPAEEVPATTEAAAEDPTQARADPTDDVVDPDEPLVDDSEMCEFMAL